MSTPTTHTDCSQGKEVECSEIFIDVEDFSPAQWHSECCIYKVPKKLREVKEEAYTPKLISIGPVHHNKKKHEYMECLKLGYFKEFFSGTTRKGQKEFANIIQKNEKKIRHFYAEEISLPEKEDFVKMILLDSIFIIELFLRNGERQEYEKYDYILCKPWLEEGIKQDLILLENQLPLFILDELHHHIGRPTGSHNSFIHLACIYFFPSHMDIVKRPIEKEVKHFTDLVRYFAYPPNLKTGKIIQHLHGAIDLDIAGLKFLKQPEGEHRQLLDIQIKKYDLLQNFPPIQTSLVVPTIVINHVTEHLFRNLMAFEQCHYPFQAYICNYIVLLDFLINTREDVELLVKKKIIVHSLGSSKEVAKMVKRLRKEIVEKNSCYHDIAEDLNEHYYNWWNLYIASMKNKNIASLKTIYFGDIWKGTATMVGIIVLLVTVGSFLTPFFMHN